LLWLLLVNAQGNMIRVGSITAAVEV